MLDAYPTFVVLALAFAVGIGVPVMVYRWQNKKYRDDCNEERKAPDFFDLALTGMVLFIFVAVLGWWQAVTRIDSQTVILSADRVVVDFPNGALLWSWDKRLKGTTREVYSRLTAAARVGSSPINPNPEVKELVCEVELETVGTVEGYLRRRKTEWIATPQATLQWYLNEFEHANHTALGRFYNSYDANQQKEFRKMVTDYLAPHLEGAGIYIKSARFRPPNVH